MFAKAHAKCFLVPRVRLPRPAGNRSLLLRPEKEIVRAVGHENLRADLARAKAAVRRRGPAFSIQPLDKRSLGKQFSPRRSFVGTDCLQQQAVDRAGIGAAVEIVSGMDEILLLRPHPTAVERALPGHISEPRRIGPNPVGVLYRT